MKNKKKKQKNISSGTNFTLPVYPKNEEFMGEYKEAKSNTVYVHPGDKVIMTDKYKVPNEIKGVIFTVISSPRYINGIKCAKLEGYEKDYPVDGLKIVG